MHHLLQPVLIIEKPPFRVKAVIRKSNHFINYAKSDVTGRMGSVFLRQNRRFLSGVLHTRTMDGWPHGIG